MDDELRLDVNGSLGVVALHESIGARHDARFFVREIDLRRRLNAQLRKLGTRASGLLAVALLLFALRQSFCMLGLNLCVTCRLALLDLRASLIDLRDQVFAPLDLLWNIQFQIARGFRGLRQLHQTRDLTPQLRLDLTSVPVTQGVMLGGICFDLRAVQTDLADRQHAELSGHEQHLQKDAG
jgi:hypothetical protein